LFFFFSCRSIIVISNSGCKHSLMS
jgi:hypothetical protein